jgi:hypothetical protein
MAVQKGAGAQELSRSLRSRPIADNRPGKCVIRPDPQVSTMESGPLDSRLPDGDIPIR